MKNKNLLSNETHSQRVVFQDSRIRDRLFSELKEEFGSWKNVGKYFNIYKSRLENLRNGSISIPYSQFTAFLKYTNKEDYAKCIMLKDKNWGRSKGGKSTYERHKEIFEKGRKIGAMKLIKSVNLDINLTPPICEFIGAFIGDGFMNKYGSRYIIQITGDSRLDREYYKNSLLPAIKKMSPESKPGIWHKDNTLRLTVYSKSIYKIFAERLGMKNGKKTFVITIPDEIINSKDYNLINACVRGIFDTDGCVAFDKRKAYAKPYIRIILNMKSLTLIKQVYEILLHQDINATITKDGETIQINGIVECNKFIDKIGFSNPRHLNKIKNL